MSQDESESSLRKSDSNQAIISLRPKITFRNSSCHVENWRCQGTSDTFCQIMVWHGKQWDSGEHFLSREDMWFLTKLYYKEEASKLQIEWNRLEKFNHEFSYDERKTLSQMEMGWRGSDQEGATEFCSIDNIYGNAALKKILKKIDL